VTPFDGSRGRGRLCRAYTSIASSRCYRQWPSP